MPASESRCSTSDLSRFPALNVHWAPGGRRCKNSGISSAFPSNNPLSSAWIKLRALNTLSSPATLTRTQHYLVTCMFLQGGPRLHAIALNIIQNLFWKSNNLILHLNINSYQWYCLLQGVLLTPNQNFINKHHYSQKIYGFTSCNFFSYSTVTAVTHQYLLIWV